MRPTIRYARRSDLLGLIEIQNYYIRESYATFDEAPLTPAEREAWFGAYAEAGPYRMLVAEEGPRLLGCAYSSRYREHPAFRETIETSIYLAPDARQRGVGSALYEALFSALSGERLHRAVAGIALPNPASVALHRRFGFREVGVFHEYAQKRGQRLSSLWMEKALDGAW